ncbi:MAG: Ig-like domain-containing protein [Colwellia sp.]|uniref:Ig-like domain-containing protein n=1 Tax=Colwellia sp. TaxID=56799 RepID=UPI0025C02CDB|nr:Ig-like domain-containing protein [Colwellia sp.]NQZ26545.1 Ig-like domain-containing protein [Colwellia sp.]
MQLLRRLSFTMLLMSMMTLVACGDGDGDLTGGDDGGGSSGGAIVTITKSDGDLSADNDITIFTSILLESDNSPVVNKLVTFTLNDPAMATFDPVIGTAVTDAAGVAQITVKVTDVAGGVEVIASVTSTTTSDSATVSIGFTSLGDGQGTPPIGEPVAASIKLFTSTQQLASSGAQSIELTAIAKDASNNLVEGVTINFASDTGSLEKILDEIGNSTNVTGPDGKVSMMLSTQAEPSNRVITVTIISGDVTDSLTIDVVGTALTLTGSASLALNDEANYIVNVLDSDGNGVPKAVVDISLSGASTESPAGAVAVITLPATVTTDAEGQAIVKATGTSGGTNTIIISALGASATQNVSVQADSFLFTNFSNGTTTVNPSVTPIVPDVSLTQMASVTLTWKRELTPVVGKVVTFTTTRGLLLANDGVTPISEGTTNTDGQVTVNLTSTDAGKAIVTLVGFDNVDGKDIELTNQLEFEFFADTAASIKAQASPNSIGPNEQTSTISVVVKDANGNLVKNKRIKFVLEDVSGGSIFPATAVTDSSGSASTVYTSNSTSAKDAVVVTASVEEEPSINDIVNLTVSERGLFISLGTGRTLLAPEGETTLYIKEYSILVSDTLSKAVPDVVLTVSAVPESYYKGFWMRTYDGDDFKGWADAGFGSIEKPTSYIATTKCANEDINFNGILDAGEDFNGDGELTPGNIVTFSTGDTTTANFVTDASGHALIKVYYQQSYARWLDIRLIVSGKVIGSEGSTQTIFTLPVLAEHVNSEDASPPHQGLNHRGPFGLSNVCSDNISQDPP